MPKCRWRRKTGDVTPGATELWHRVALCLYFEFFSFRSSRKFCPERRDCLPAAGRGTMAKKQRSRPATRVHASRACKPRQFDTKGRRSGIRLLHARPRLPRHVSLLSTHSPHGWLGGWGGDLAGSPLSEPLRVGMTGHDNFPQDFNVLDCFLFSSPVQVLAETNRLHV